MKVQELIQQLLKCDSEAEVVIYHTADHEDGYWEYESVVSTELQELAQCRNSTWKYYEDHRKGVILKNCLVLS